MTLPMRAPRRRPLRFAIIGILAPCSLAPGVAHAFKIHTHVWIGANVIKELEQGDAARFALPVGVEFREEFPRAPGGPHVASRRSHELSNVNDAQ